MRSPVDVSLPAAWTPGLEVVLNAAAEYGVSEYQ